MKLLTAALAASALTTGGHPREGDKIPGESPLALCRGDHTNDLARIERVDLNPNPPEPGEGVEVHGQAFVRETILDGAYVNVQVKYGLIRLLSTRVDLCDQAEKNIDMKCPVEPGLLNITKEVELPSEIPPGRYTVLADVYTVDQRPITCVTGTVRFGGHHDKTAGSESGGSGEIDL